MNRQLELNYLESTLASLLEDREILTRLRKEGNTFQWSIAKLVENQVKIDRCKEGISNIHKEIITGLSEENKKYFTF